MRVRHDLPAIIRNSILILSIFTILLACENAQEIKVGLLWNDDTYFDRSGSRFLGIVEGEYDLDTGFDATPLGITRVQPGTNDSHGFSFSASSSDNYTAFIFVDINDNGRYDEGYDIVSGYKYNCGEPGECLNISVSAFY